VGTRVYQLTLIAKPKNPALKMPRSFSIRLRLSRRINGGYFCKCSHTKPVDSIVTIFSWRL